MKISESVFLFEHPENIEVLKVNLRDGDTVIALNQYADFELEKNHISHLLFEGDIFSSQKFYEDLFDYSYQWILKLTRSLDEILFDVDRRFADNKLNVFHLCYNYFYYLIQPWHIAAYDLYNLCLNNKISVIKIIENDISENKNDYSYPDCFYDRNFSIYNIIVENYSEKFNFSVQQIKSGSVIKSNKENQVQDSQSYNNGISLKSILKKVKRKIQKQKSDFVILNCRCQNMRSISGEMLKEGFFIEEFPDEDYRKLQKKEYEYAAAMLKGIEDLKLLDFDFYGLNLFDPLKPKIKEFISCLENIYSNFAWLEWYIKNNNFDIVIFMAHAGWLMNYDYLVILIPILKKYKIPFVTFSHGIYGFNTSAQLFQDMPHCENYFVGGEAMARNLKKVWPRKDIKYFIGGQPRIEKEYENYRNIDLSKKSKKTILYAPWNGGEYNVQALWVKKPYMRYGFWPTVKRVIDFLNEYSNEYEIVIKPQADSLAELYKEYLDVKKYSGISISYKEKKYCECIAAADIIIVHTISTHSIEAAYSKADIFILEDCDMDEDIVSLLENRMFVSKNLNQFKFDFAGYLNKKEFYAKSEDVKFLNSVSDFKNKDDRVINLKFKISEILNGQ